MDWHTKTIIQTLRNEMDASRKAFTPEQMAVLENMVNRFVEALDIESRRAGSIHYSM